MSQQQKFAGFILKQVEARPLFSIFITALVLRFGLLALGFVDYWGDAHHNLIMSKLTLDNNWLYTDFKDRQYTWLPWYRYWGALVMWLTGTYSLFVMNVVNSVIGAITALLGGWFTLKLADLKTALWAGFAIALMPYLMIFSYVNMGEMQGGLLLLLWVIGVSRKNFWVVAISALLAALTRYELIFLVAIALIPLWVMNQRKAVYFSIGGLGLALTLWSIWAWVNSGNPLNWLLMRIDSTTQSSGFYAEDANTLFRFVFLPLAAILQAFPLVIFFIWFKKKGSMLSRKFTPQYLMGFLIISHLVFFLVAQTKIMAYPDTRFFVISLPIATIWFMLLLRGGYFRPFVRPRIVFFLLGLSLLQLIVPFYRQYSLQPRKEVGEWMAKNLETDTKVWSDLAVAIVESGYEPSNFHSSENLYPKNERGFENAHEFLGNRLKSQNIEYLSSYPAPFDYTSQLIPQLNNHEAFEWNGISFVPVFVYYPYQMKVASAHNFLRYQFEKATFPASVWRIYTH
jgi:hypothetical protein